MTTEASARYNWPFAGIVYRLKQNPLEVQKLTVFRQAIDEIPRFGLQVLSIPPALIAVAAALSQQTGLLSNDALIVAIMQANGLTNLASEDSDFDRAPGIARYAPA
jgi:predicted nucleic acid-binding protein